MSERTLRVALVAGPMYDGLYETLATFEKTAGVHVEVAHRAPHPELNAHLASLGRVPYDLVSTHTKYAPSQLSFLAPLDEYADQLDMGRFYAPLIDLAKIGGRLYGIPRNIDVKLLHYRSDLVDHAPADWNVLIETARRLSTGARTYGFVFPGWSPVCLACFTNWLKWAEQACSLNRTFLC